MKEGIAGIVQHQWTVHISLKAGLAEIGGSWVYFIQIHNLRTIDLAQFVNLSGETDFGVNDDHIVLEIGSHSIGGKVDFGSAWSIHVDAFCSISAVLVVENFHAVFATAGYIEGDIASFNQRTHHRRPI